jgi:prolyl 4-hydroxylase
VTTRTLHGGAPVLEGEKWVATKWLREREFT